MAPRNRISEQAGISQEAAEWLATLDEACSDEQKRAFAAWLRRSNLHVEAFLRLSALMHQVQQRASWQAVDVERLIDEARATANVTPLPGSHPPRSLQWRRPFPIVAVAAACLALAWILTMVMPALLNRDGTLYRTTVGEQRSIALADGSVIELNTQSAVRTHFTANERAIELVQGEAIFKVAKDAHRPFLVRSGAARIVAVGTAFNVNARAGGAIVTVLEGRVRVSNRTELATAADVLAAPAKVEVGRGEQVALMPARSIEPVALADTESATSWTQRRLVFDDEPLSSVVTEFARYYDAKTIRIEDPMLAARRITGVFDAGDPGALVQFLANYSDVAIREDDRGWVIASAHASSPLASQ